MASLPKGYLTKVYLPNGNLLKGYANRKGIFTYLVCFIENVKNYWPDVFCPRYVVEEGDTLAGIALRYIVYHGGKMGVGLICAPPGSTLRSRIWSKPTSFGPTRAFGLANLSEFPTLRWIGLDFKNTNDFSPGQRNFFRSERVQRSKWDYVDRQPGAQSCLQ